MHTRLVQNDMRHVRQAIFNVLHAAAAHNMAAVATTAVVGFPEGGLVDPIGFLQHTLGKTEGLEHLHRAAGDAIGLAQLQGAGFLLHDHRPDGREGGQLRRQRQAGRAATHNQHVGFKRQGVRRSPFDGGYGRIQKPGVPGSKSVEMKLHCWVVSLV